MFFIDLLRRLFAPRPINITVVLQVQEDPDPDEFSPGEVAERVHARMVARAEGLARRCAAAGQTP